jgi:transcriptional regulator with XRE-family HTH domain
MGAHEKAPEYGALGRAVRMLREQIGLSQEAVAVRACLRRSYVGAIERGEINPSFRILVKLAQGLSVPPSRLLHEYEALRAYGSGTAATERPTPRAGGDADARPA